MTRSTESLSPLDVEILQRLAACRVTVSAVKLAAEMWEASERTTLGWGDASYDLVEYALRELNASGLVVYRIAPEMQITTDGTVWIESAKHSKGVPVHIRLTEEGFAAIGYTTRAVQVGNRRSYFGEAPVRPGDGTDFRNLGYMAVAFGPIERCDLQTHLSRYPDHRYSTPGGF